TARLLGQYLGKRTRGPLFLSDRKPGDGTVPQRDIDPASGRRRISYATVARRLSDATGGWTPHDLRHSRLTHAGEDGATEADLMNLSGHKDRRTLQRYLRPSLESTHRRLDEIDARRGAWTPDADEIAAKLTDASAVSVRHPRASETMAAGKGAACTHNRPASTRFASWRRNRTCASTARCEPRPTPSKSSLGVTNVNCVQSGRPTTFAAGSNTYWARCRARMMRTPNEPGANSPRI